jgi:hypothetical protein
MCASDLALSLGIFFHVGFQRHAAASYGHLDILTYLISKGTEVGGSSFQLIILLQVETSTSPMKMVIPLSTR